MPVIRLTWSLPPHSPAGRFAHKSQTPHYYFSRFFRQDLHLSRTMLTVPWTAYVDRFACDWIRLATTDPYIKNYIRIIQKLSTQNIFSILLRQNFKKNASTNFTTIEKKHRNLKYYGLKNSKSIIVKFTATILKRFFKCQQI